MPHVQVRDVSEATHAELTRRACTAGKSLQQFLSEQLEEIASKASLDEVLNRIAGRSDGSLTGAEARVAIESERARR